MQTREFRADAKELMRMAKDAKTAIMCAEAHPWRCHRSMIGDALQLHGFSVMDIFSEKILKPHTLNPFARVRGKKITYPES